MRRKEKRRIIAEECLAGRRTKMSGKGYVLIGGGGEEHNTRLINTINYSHRHGWACEMYQQIESTLEL